MRKSRARTIKGKAAATIREKLTKEMLDNPARLFTAQEIHLIIRRAENFVLAAKKSGAPFPGGVSRPEWVLDWLRLNPGFTVKASEWKRNHKNNH